MMGSERVTEHLHCAMSTSKQSIDIEPFLEAFDLTHRANDSIANLSQGQARKVAVLAGLLPAFASQAPGLLLLDEPGAGLDEGAVKALSGWLEELRALGHGLLLATHDERLRNHATHLLDLASGSIEAVEVGPETIAARRPSSMPVRAGVACSLRCSIAPPNADVAQHQRHGGVADVGRDARHG